MNISRRGAEKKTTKQNKTNIVIHVADQMKQQINFIYCIYKFRAKQKQKRNEWTD